MSPGALPFFAIPVVLLLALVYYVTRYDFHRFDDPPTASYCEPQVKSGDRRVGTELAYASIGALKRGDLVRFASPRSPRTLTSRVIGLPGDRVAIQEGVLRVNGEPYQDRYRSRGASGIDWLPELLVPDDCVFVVHDMRQTRSSDQTDSRSLGPIPFSALELSFSQREPVSGP